MSRVVVAGIHAESNLRSERLIRRSDFTEVAGRALLAHADFVGLNVEGVVFVGGYRARAVSGGAVEAAALDTLTERLIAHIDGIDGVDGILLCTHGGMRTLDDVDADGAWITRVRAAVGPSLPIVAVFDTHGTPSHRTLAALDGVATYRTVPHVDQIATMQRATSQLLRRIEGEPRPHVVFEPVPLRLPAERASTLQGPLSRTIAQLERAADDGVDADVFIGQGWAPAGVATVGVVAQGADALAARRWARALAQSLWEHRGAFDYPIPAYGLDAISTLLDDAGNDALVIADSGDVPGAGAPGDRLDLLDVLTADPRFHALIVAVAIPAWVEACTGYPTGALVEVYDPYDARCFVATVVAPAREFGAYGRCVVISIRNVAILVVERRGDPPAPEQLEVVDLDLASYSVIVLKTGFVPDVYRAGRRAILALSPGVTEHTVVNRVR